MSVVGVVLAGGAGRRMGGDKAVVEHEGRALLLHVLDALAAVTPEQAVIAKRSTRLPELPTTVWTWIEPDEPLHPLAGILHALRRAGGRSVLCCAADLPRLDAATLGRLLDAGDRHPGACVVPRVAGAVEPLCAIWHPRASGPLHALDGELRMRDAVEAVDAIEVAFDDPGPFVNVNSPGDLAALSRR